MRRCLLFGLLGALFGPLSSPGRTAEIDFNRDIRPILSDNCFACHGFDEKTRKAKLRLDVAEGAYAERKGRFPIKPGDLQNSEVWQRIIAEDESIVMPPPHTNKKLTAAQKQTIRTWIEQGAKYRKHWAFEPPTAPSIPQVKQAAWVKTPIDKFILARLEKEGLQPQPQADRETLIRRVSFALTGLPPTLAELDAFLADRSPNAYEKMVDRYLASPHFGEEMAKHWLDVARYADTHGLHLDNERQMWAYRDWVVSAFNRNLPFDQFTIEQIAGDLLPQPTREQLIATGFNRCNVTTSEGGSINEEFIYRYAVDRASTTLQVWLGLTAGCAVCHDHKYDPISMKDFYSVYAFFNSSSDPAMDGNVATTSPFLRLPTTAQEAAIQATKQAEAAAQQRFQQLVATWEYRDPAEQMPPPAKRLIRDALFDDAFPAGASASNTSRNAADWVYEPKIGTISGKRVLRQANANTHQDNVTNFAKPVIVPESAEVEVWVYLDAHKPPHQIALTLNPGQQVTWSKGGSRPLPETGRWVKLTVRAQEMGLQPGQKIPGFRLQEWGGVVYWDALAIRGEIDPAKDPYSSLRVWWKSLGKTPPAGTPSELHAVLPQGPDQPITPEVRQKLVRHYLATYYRGNGDAFTQALEAREAARQARLAAEESVIGTMIFGDLPQPRQAFVMLRGQYDKPGEKVEPGVLSVLHPLKKAKPEGRANRLDLARWLVDRDNPLTARVAVNRLWQQMFGRGLVKTSYDFGSQGEPPSHPELLDYLAISYRDGGWDTKKLLKEILMSATFQQQSQAPAEVRRRDPENRLYARGPRFRLDAEQIRDNALFTSGLINLEMGGRGVRPYQPPGIWEPVGYADSNTRFYLQDHGPALYRRSLYVFLKRTAPPPFMSNFDGPNREQVCAVRERSNTPLQALQLMNDVQHFEAARALAERALAEGGTTLQTRIEFLYRVVLSRKPTAKELATVESAWSMQHQLYQANELAAKQAIQVGESKPKNLAPPAELAAWTMIANLILNLDETLNRN